jgi:hypothetical protein
MNPEHFPTRVWSKQASHTKNKAKVISEEMENYISPPHKRQNSFFGAEV